MTATVQAADGRTLMYESWGAPDGDPVFFLHGTPGSRLQPHPRWSVLYRLGIRLICPDRPGYGGSDPLHHRSVAHAAADVAAIADQLELDRFAVVGRSGGASHALACAALLPERVTRVAALVALAPRDAEGLDWYDGMTQSNVEFFRAAESGYAELAALVGACAERIRRDPLSELPFDPADLPAPDRSVLADYGVRTMLYDNFVEALKSDAGWTDDTYSAVRPWGFAVGEITRPVLLWHGELDIHSPVAHTRWLAAHIPGAQFTVDRDSAHFGAIFELPRVLNWVTEGTAGRLVA